MSRLSSRHLERIRTALREDRSLPHYGRLGQDLFGDRSLTGVSDRDLAQDLIAGHYLNADQLAAGLAEQGRRRAEGREEPLGRILVDQGAVSLETLVQVLEARERSLFVEAEKPLMLGPGGQISHYSLTREIARGGMGIVFEAEDSRLKRQVAVKVLREEGSGPEVTARFQREATIAAHLHHPNIVTLHEFGMVRDAAGRPVHFLVMEYVDGKTFQDLLPAIPLPERLKILEEVARALAYAHEQGVIHRDLKPANVMVESGGRVVLTDFGLARADAIASRLTRSLELIGTPQYMAPEQVEGRAREIDRRTDVYALGVMLYEALVGRPPFQSRTPAKLYQQILQEEPPPPRTADRDLEVVCRKAMAKQPRDRYASALDFAEDLRRHREGEPIRARPPSVFVLSTRWVRRHRWALVLVGMMVLAGGIALGLSLKASQRTQANEALESAQLYLDQARRLEEAGPWDVAAWRDSLARAEAEIVRSRTFVSLPRADLLEGHLRMLREDWAGAADSYGRVATAEARIGQIHAFLELSCRVEDEFVFLEDPSSPGEPEKSPHPLASASVSQRDWARRAREAIEEVRRLGLQPPEGVSARAVEAFLQGDISALRQTVDDSGGNDYVVRLLAEAYRRNRSPLEAIQHYETLVRRRPNTARYRAHLALLCVEARRYPDAIREANAALRLMPDRIDARFYRGIARNRAWIDGDRTEENGRLAATDFAAIRERNPERYHKGGLSFAHGNALYHVWKHTHRVADLEEAIALRRAALTVVPPDDPRRPRFEEELRAWEREVTREEKH